MASVVELAQASKASYDTNPQLSGWRQIARYGQRFQGFSCVIFNQGDEYIMAFRGTDGLSDIDDDAQLALGVMPVQYRAARQSLLMAMTTHNVRDSKLYLTGHSLGGGIAALLSARHTTALPVVTFNAPGMRRAANNAAIRNILGPLVSLMIGDSTREYRRNFKKVMHLRTEYDVVSMGTGSRIGGETTTLPNNQCGGLSGWAYVSPAIAAKETAERSLCAHGIDVVIAALGHQPEMAQDLGWV